MMNAQTHIAIIGAGASGLTTAAILSRCGIPCVVLERSPRSHVEERQRAGNLDTRSVRIFEEWGLVERVAGGVPYGNVTELVIDGEKRELRERLSPAHGEPAARMCPQQVLIRNLLTVADEEGIDIRFDAEVVEITGLDKDIPIIRYRDADGRQHELLCHMVAGCDGFHGASRKAIPQGVLTRYDHDHGITWLNILMEAPPRIRMAIGRSGFAAQFPRGPKRSRFYLQVKKADSEDDWSDARIRAALIERLADPSIADAAILEKQILQLRAMVFEPMRYHSLFLIGDAAHLISPIPGKGMNLALHDAHIFASAVQSWQRDGDASALDSYSDRSLRRVWNYQEFSAWNTAMLHDPSDISPVSPFEKKLATARLARLLESEDACTAYSELMAGLA